MVENGALFWTIQFITGVFSEDIKLKTAIFKQFIVVDHTSFWTGKIETMYRTNIITIINLSEKSIWAIKLKYELHTIT